MQTRKFILNNCVEGPKIIKLAEVYDHFKPISCCYCFIETNVNLIISVEFKLYGMPNVCCAECSRVFYAV